MKQALSYIGEHINNGNMEIRINKECLNFLKSKIVYAVIKSRHSNSTKYNVYVKYQTNSNSVDAIESWYCTCKAGMRTVGCCSHVASIIYFLSYGKYLEHIPNPNSKLTSIFPASNYKICLQKKKSVISKEKKSKLLNSNESNDSLIESDYSNDCFCESGLENNNGIDDLNKSFKRLLSVDTDEQQAIKRPTRSQNKTSNALYSCLNIEDFKLRIPEWGGHIVNGKNIQIKTFKIVNTCTIDYFLLSLWACFRLNNKISNEILHLSFDKTQYLIEIINSIEFIQWNKAKSIWILMFLFDVHSIDCDCVECRNILSKNEISTFGSEYEFFLEPIIQIQAYTFLSMCSFECDLNNITKESVALTFEKDKKKVNLLFTHKLPCRNCRSNVNAQFKQFKNNPPWVFVQTNDSEIYAQEVPKKLTIGVKNYQLLTATIHLNNHFRAIFYLNNELFLIDDLNHKKITKRLPKLKVGTCFFYCTD